jgi:hypothetical protein
MRCVYLVWEARVRRWGKWWEVWMVDDRQEEPQSRSRMVDGGFWRSCTGQPWGLRLLGFFQPNAPRLPISQSGCCQWGVEASLIHSAGISPTTTKKIRKQGQSIFKMKISKVRRSYLKSTLTNNKAKLLKLSRTEEKIPKQQQRKCQVFRFETPSFQCSTQESTTPFHQPRISIPCPRLYRPITFRFFFIYHKRTKKMIATPPSPNAVTRPGGASFIPAPVFITGSVLALGSGVGVDVSFLEQGHGMG